MTEEETNKEAPKAPEPQPSPVESKVDEKIIDMMDNMPKDDPVIPDKGDALIDMLGTRMDERMAQFENKMNAMFVKMGGTVREGAAATSTVEAQAHEQEYVPLSELDYRI